MDRKDKKFDLRDLGFLSLVVLLLLITVFALRGLDANPTPTSAEIRSLIEGQVVDSVLVKDNTLTMTLKEPWNGQDTVTAKLYSAELFYQEYNDILVRQRQLGILSDYDYLPNTVLPWWISILPWLAVFGLFGLLWYNMMIRQVGGAGGVEETGA